MSFDSHSFDGNSIAKGSAHKSNTNMSFSSQNIKKTKLKRSSSIRSFERSSISSSDASIPFNSTATKFGTGSLRRSSLFRLEPYHDQNPTTAFGSKDNSFKELTSKSTDLPQLDFDLSRSALTSIPSQSASSVNSCHKFPLFPSNNTSPNIKRLSINPTSSKDFTIRRMKKQHRRFHQGSKRSLHNRMPASKNASSTNISDTNTKPNFSIPLGTPLQNPEMSSLYDSKASAVNAGYWITPSLETLFSYTFDQLKSVKDLQIGRKNHGSIRYTGVIDLSTIKNLTDILGNIVVFDSLTVSVYPENNDDLVKAFPGEELNNPAIVTLENVFIYVPVGKAKMKLTDPADPRVKSHTDHFNERIKARGGQFITYDVATGTYVFKVDHFSSWGFDESDLLYDNDVQNDPMDQDNYTPQPSHETYDQNTNDNPGLSSLPNDLDSDYQSQNGFSLNISDFNSSQVTKPFEYTQFPLNNSFPATFSHFQSQNAILLPTRTTTNVIHDGDSIADDCGSTVSRLSRLEDYPNQALAVYEIGSRLEQGRVADSWIKQLSFASTFDSSLAPPISGLQFSKENSLQIPNFSSKTNFNAHNIDVEIFGGLSQMKNSSVVGQYRQAAKTLRLSEPFASFSFAKFSSFFLLKNTHSPSSFEIGNKQITSEISTHTLIILENLLADSQMSRRKTGFPIFKPGKRITFDDIKNMFSGVKNRDSDIFSLASVLFDDINIHGIRPLDSLSKEAAQKQTEKYRSQLLSKWLINMVASETVDQVKSASGSSLNQALAYLYGNQITKAALAASNGGNLHLATLISLLGSPGNELKQTAKSQIKDWSASGALGYIPSAVRIIFEIASGNTSVSQGINASYDSKAAPTLNISQGLSWLQSFGLRLWYECTTEQPISEAVKCYEEAFTTLESKVPAPFIAGSSTRCVEFELLSLYKSSDFDLEALFNPTSVSGNAFNYQVSWVLYHVLIRSLGLFTDTESKIGNKLCQEFAAQLELEKKYTEAVFVLSYITQDQCASRAIEQLILRNISNLTDDDIEILCGKLQISHKLLSNARALEYRYQGNHWDECKQLIQAENFEEARYRIVSKVAPKAVISNTLGDLLTLLLQFKSANVISTLARGCQVYLDYIYLFEEAFSKERQPCTETDGVYFPISTQHTGNRARQAYAGSGLSTYDVGLRLMNGLEDIEFENLFDTKVAVAIMSTFIIKRIKSLGLADKAALALQIKTDAIGYHQQAAQLSEIYFRNKVSVS